MEKDFKSIAFLAVFVMITGCVFYFFDFYDSAFFTLLTGLTMLAVYHAGLYNRGIIETNTIASQKEIIERDKKLIRLMDAYVSILESCIRDLKEDSRETRSTKTKK